MKAKGAPNFCVVFDFFHKERHKADMTTYPLSSFVGVFIGKQCLLLV